ncbi:MAG: two-component regulator propeller domain-containing protein [Candidatus Kapaibacteriota bacterium]|jgi:ligand-binding sensor domain-containing protein
MVSKNRSIVACIAVILSLGTFCFLASLFVASAQDFQRIAPHPEAPQSAITAILQDHRGFLWFADESGLHRYDGRNFTAYRINPEKSNLENAVSALCQDSAGTLWLALGHRLAQFDRRQERIIPYNGASDTAINTTITALCADKQGGLWVVREYSLEYRFNGKLQQFPHPQSRINTALFAGDNQLWLGTGRGLETFDATMKTFVSKSLQSGLADTTSDISSLAADARAPEAVLVGTASGELWRTRSGQSETIMQGRKRILTLLGDRESKVWCATAGGGLFTVEPDAARNLPFTNDFGGGRFFTSLFEDKQGIVWLGATDGSIYKFDRFLRKFTPFKPDMAKLPEAQGFLTLSLYEDSERIVWIGSERGLFRYNPQTGAWKLFKYDKRDKTSISSDNISCVYEDSSKRLWVGTTAGGLNVFDRKTQHFRAFRHNAKDSNAISSDNISCIYEDRRGRIWIGTWINGLNLFDAATERFTSYRSNPQKISTLSSNSISYIAEDRLVADGTLWIGTYEDGLNAFHPTIQAFTRHLHQPTNPQSLSSNAVSSVCELSDGTLWVTTDAGLDKFDRRSQVFTRYGVQHGLPNEVLSAVVGDKRGNIWVMGASTITKFLPQIAKAHYYDVSDGLGTSLIKNDAEPEQFSSRAYCVARDGAIYFGTSSGFVRFHPDSIRNNSYLPPVVITALKKFNAPAALPVAIAEADTIELSYTDNFITFEFAALNFSAPEKNRYKYTLEGFDKSWIDAGTKTEAVYTNLDGGEYTFRVIACNNDGLWNETGRTLRVIVHPPFWRTRWFYAIVAIALIGGTWSSVRWRVRRLRLRNDELRRLVEQRTAELTASMQDLEKQRLHTEERSREVERLNDVLNTHNAELAAQTRTAQLEMLRYQLNPHFLFNALISISDLVQEDAKHAVRALRSLMAYLRYALQPAGLPTVPLSEEINAVQNYLAIEKVRFEERLNVIIETTPDADDYYVPGFMLQPLVENAIKYGMRTSLMPLEIRIKANMLEGALHLEVWNSGSLKLPDNTAKPEGTGTGMRNIQERLQVLFPERHEVSLSEDDGQVRVSVVLYPE